MGFEDGGLAASIRAEQTHEAAIGHGDVDLVDDAPSADVDGESDQIEAHPRRPVEVGAPADQEDQDRAADEGSDDADGHLLGGDDGAGEQITHHHEGGAEKRADGENLAVIGADEEADDMGHDQTDESDHPAHGHCHADHEGGDDEEVPAHGVDIDPEGCRRTRLPWPGR